MHEGQPVTDLVARARSGEQRAWDELVERYSPLVLSICRTYLAGRADVHDVGQNVWLQLVGQLDSLREPTAFASWLATITRYECFRVLRARRPPVGTWALEAEDIPDHQGISAEDELLRAERHAALHEAMACLPPGWRQIFSMLLQDPPVPYAQISATLGIPLGSIGPTRRRCLQTLRRHPALVALMSNPPSWPR